MPGKQTIGRDQRSLVPTTIYESDRAYAALHTREPVPLPFQALDIRHSTGFENRLSGPCNCALHWDQSMASAQSKALRITSMARKGMVRSQLPRDTGLLPSPYLLNTPDPQLGLARDPPAIHHSPFTQLLCTPNAVSRTTGLRWRPRARRRFHDHGSQHAVRRPAVWRRVAVWRHVSGLGGPV